jgi:glucan phosphorylase
MTDITAQAFRNAAAQLYESLGSPWRDLLLAAAEQREQLDAANAQLDLYMAENEELSQQVVDLGLWNASQREQIATLTAEHDEARTALAQAVEQIRVLREAK